MKIVTKFENGRLFNGNSLHILKSAKDNYFHAIISDIPYGIGYDTWDILHVNTNSALLGSSPSQRNNKSCLFRTRGKPLNGWSEKDKQIGKEYYNWCYSWAKDWLRVLKPGGSALVFSSRRLSHHLMLALENANFILKDVLIWKKSKAPFKAQKISNIFDKRKDFINSKKYKSFRLGNLCPMYEPIIWCMKPYKLGTTITDNVITNGIGAYNGEAWKTYCGNYSNIIEVSVDKHNMGLHPTQKPIKLMKALIELVTLPDQKILDPFCGSGTTLLAAKFLKRQFYGIEQDKKYYNIAKIRLEEETNNKE